jgi:hypothetical protein
MHIGLWDRFWDKKHIQYVDHPDLLEKVDSVLSFDEKSLKISASQDARKRRKAVKKAVETKLSLRTGFQLDELSRRARKFVLSESPKPILPERVVIQEQLAPE